MQKKIFWTLLTTAFASMLGLGIISPFLPEFASKHGVNGFWLGVIFAGYGISRGFIMPIVGRISDRRGRKILVSAGLLLFSAISLFYPAAKSVWSLTLVRMIHGLAAGMIMPIVMAYIGDFTKKGAEGVTTGAMNTMFYLGMAAGPFLGGFLDHFYGFNSIFYTMCGLGLLTFLMVLFFLPESRPMTSQVKIVEHTTFRKLLHSSFIRAILIISVVITFMMISFIALLPSLAAIDHIDAVHIGIIISVGIFLGGIFQIPFGKLADKFDDVGKLIMIGIGTSLGMFSLIVMPFCPNFDALLIAGAFMGLGAGVSAPALSSLAVIIGRKTAMGTWMGIFNCVKSIAFVVTPLVAGIIMDYMGLKAAFYCITMIAFFGGLGYIYYVFKRYKEIRNPS